MKRSVDEHDEVKEPEITSTGEKDPGWRVQPDGVDCERREELPVP